MKKHQPINKEEVQSLIKQLDSFHDASIKKICFIKDRDLNQDGDLTLPLEDATNVDIEIEIILNSYEGAKKDQIVVLQFQNVKVFNFYQNADFDYSDVYELKVEEDDKLLSFIFYSTSKMIKSLTVVCNQIICIER